MKFLFILLLFTVVLVYGVQTQPQPTPVPKEEIEIFLDPKNNPNIRVVKEEIETLVNPKSNPNIQVTSTTTNKPVTESSVHIDLFDRLFYANYQDSQFRQRTLDLSGLDLSGEDVMKILHGLNSTILMSLARLDLSHNRVMDLPARVWPLELEYSLCELRLDYNWLSVADPINTRTTRFELTRLRSLKKLSLSHCSLVSTLELEFPPVESLDLSGNRLVELPSSLATLGKLQHLDVSGNHLRYLGGSPLASLTGLRSLNLSSNGLETMWDDPLEKLYSLETLHLDNNVLSEPPKLYIFTGSYQPRMEVYMSGNPFKCGCSLKNTMDIERLQILDKSNITCMDDNAVKFSMDEAPAKQCSPHWEIVKQKWSGTKQWFRENHPDWSTLYRSLGWLLFGVTLGLVYAHRRAKKTPPATLEVPYNILDDRAITC